MLVESCNKLYVVCGGRPTNDKSCHCLQLCSVLMQQKDPSQLLGALSVSVRHVDKESDKESYDEPQVLSTLMYCASADAAKQLSDKMPASKKA